MFLSSFGTDGREAFTKAKGALRDPDGPWRHGPIYLFIIESTGYTIFHGAFPNRFEFQKPTDTLRDEVTGELILPQIIEVATSNPDGGFVKYYFDNPDDDTDSATIPKVTYARQHVFQITRPDGSTVPYPLIFGAGIYGDPQTQVSAEGPKNWLARFGRAVASQAVEMISNPDDRAGRGRVAGDSGRTKLAPRRRQPGAERPGPGPRRPGALAAHGSLAPARGLLDGLPRDVAERCPAELLVPHCPDWRGRGRRRRPLDGLGPRRADAVRQRRGRVPRRQCHDRHAGRGL